MSKLKLIHVILFTALIALAGCESSEEKAERYFQSGLQLLEEGDETRALVQLRNVFKYNGFHKEARNTYATTLLKRGEIREAYRQYLRLIEQYPDTLDVRLVLAETALGMRNWPEVERHGGAALKLDPDNARAQALEQALLYRQAVIDRNATQQAEVAKRVEAMIVDQPENLVLRRVMINQLLNGPEPGRTAPHIEAALAVAPKSLEFHAMKLRMLELAGDGEATGAQLQAMVELFPENDELKKSLVRWYMSQKDFDGAEAFLRAEAGEITQNAKGHLSVVQFLIQVRDRDQGRAELLELIEANKGNADADLYGAFLATMDFDDGKRDEAIAAMEAILAEAELSDQTRNIKAMLARMYDAMKNREKASALVEEILAEDATNVDASKLRASWAIAEDRPGDAIIDLRGAQSQAPRDPQIMTLLAAAFERDGSLDLAGEQLSKAVQASGSAAHESLRYAAFLRKQGRSQAATSVLTDARRVSPGNPSVLVALADVNLAAGNWAQVHEIAQTLRQFDRPETSQAAQQLQAAILIGQNRYEDGIALLEQEVSASAGDLRPIIIVAMTQLRAGKTEQARTFVDEALAKTPDSPQLRLLSANIDALMGKVEEAEKVYRDLIAENPQAEVPVRFLFGLLNGTGRRDEAEGVIDAGLAAMPDSGTLLFLKAGILERADDFDGAIEIYEKLYLADTGNIVMANNLASMISAHRDDAESLERAAAIARRLRGSENPAFQDTYGWIEFRRGNFEDALSYLEPAAKGLANDALTQFHLGMVLKEMGRKDEAVAQFQRALELGEGRNIPQLQQAQALLDTLLAKP